MTNGDRSVRRPAGYRATSPRSRGRALAYEACARRRRDDVTFANAADGMCANGRGAHIRDPQSVDRYTERGRAVGRGRQR
jgi:hypothetical protein